MNDIHPDEAYKIILDCGATIIDVRTPAEFADCHIPGARNININDSDFVESIRLLPHDAVYIVNCQTGGRSTRACVIMQKLGLVGAKNLEGGITAWKKLGLPVER